MVIRYEVSAGESIDSPETAKRWFTDPDAAVAYYERLCQSYAHVTVYGLCNDMITDVLLYQDAAA